MKNIRNAIFMVIISVLSLHMSFVHASEKETCLSCHGPFEKFISNELNVQTESGAVNPHVSIPHSSTSSDDFFECIECHAAHPLPPAQGYKDTSASLETCYSCHHNYRFEKCSNCH